VASPEIEVAIREAIFCRFDKYNIFILANANCRKFTGSTAAIKLIFSIHWDFDGVGQVNRNTAHFSEMCGYDLGWQEL